jgi:hypothetical protein
LNLAIDATGQHVHGQGHVGRGQVGVGDPQAIGREYQLRQVELNVAVDAANAGHGRESLLELLGQAAHFLQIVAGQDELQRFAALSGAHQRQRRGEGAGAGHAAEFLANGGEHFVLRARAFLARRHAHEDHGLIDLAGRAKPDERKLGMDFRVVLENGLHFLQLALGVVDARTERCPQGYAETAFVLFRKECLADVEKEEGAGGDDQGCGQHHPPAMSERTVEQTGIKTIHASEHAVEQMIKTAVLLFHPQVAGTKHGRERQRDEQRHQHAEGDDHGEGTEELADDPGEEDHRSENRHQ